MSTPDGSLRPPPRDVVRATWLMVALVVVDVVGAIVAFASGDAIRDEIRTADPTLTGDQIDTRHTEIVATAVVIAVLFTVLYLLLLQQVRRGRNWARITTFVLAGLGILNGVLGAFADVTTLEKGVNFVQALIAIGVIVLLSRRESNDYFAAMRTLY